MPASKKTMSKTRQLSALVNFVSCLRANRVKAKTRAFMRWRLVGAGDAIDASTR